MKQVYFVLAFVFALLCASTPATLLGADSAGGKTDADMLNTILGADATDWKYTPGALDAHSEKTVVATLRKRPSLRKRIASSMLYVRPSPKIKSF